MSLVSILQRQHQALPEWGGTPEVQAFTSKAVFAYLMLFHLIPDLGGSKQVKSPRRRRNRNETSGAFVGEDD